MWVTCLKVISLNGILLPSFTVSCWWGAVMLHFALQRQQRQGMTPGSPHLNKHYQGFHFAWKTFRWNCHGQMRGTNPALKGFKVEKVFPPPNFLVVCFVCVCVGGCFPCSLKFLYILAGKGEWKKLFCWTQQHLIQTDLAGNVTARLKDILSLSKVTVPDLLQGGSRGARTTSKGALGSCVRLQTEIALAGQQHLLAYSQM